ncbi:MAG: efflux RND transporter permease subunit, partial [Chlamydiota bacterium]
MISRFFLNRPIFAMVISILIVLVGGVAFVNLPIEQYPNITPPQIQVSANYPGASAQILSDSVAAPLENQINGVEDMIYMYSQNAATGNMTMSIYFDIGTDSDIALNNVQDRVNLATPQLPSEVQKEGIVVKKETPTILLLVTIDSDGRQDEIYTNNYATIHVADEILRLQGVSDAKLINARNYSMRVWLRPDKMAQLHIGTSDVIDCINNQSSDYPMGQLGEAPTAKPVDLTLSMTSLGRLSTPDQFDEIILRATSDGATVKIKDIGHTELGAQDYTVNGAVNGKTSALIAVYQEYGANALTVADSVKETVARLSKNFPPGITYSIPYDTTTFIKLSIEEVERTLYEAAILVALVVFVFLQSIRATIVPVVAMIVSIVGTFAGMYVLGFSLNTLTLFALVLSIGIVVDDAIVVVENVERNIREKQLGAKEAAIIAMQEVTSPVIAIVCVLCSVFIPVAFLGGIAGGLYKQFAITIAISVVISGFVALTLSPVLAAMLLQKHSKPNKLAIMFNNGLNRCTERYAKGAEWIIDHWIVAWTGFIAIIVCLVCLFKIIPSSLVPQEDQGYLFTFAFLPEGASLDRTQAVTDEMTPIALSNPAVETFIS